MRSDSQTSSVTPSSLGKSSGSGVPGTPLTVRPNHFDSLHVKFSPPIK
jgi:hypothetical protein